MDDSELKYQSLCAAARKLDDEAAELYRRASELKDGALAVSKRASKLRCKARESGGIQCERGLHPSDPDGHHCEGHLSSRSRR